MRRLRDSEIDGCKYGLLVRHVHTGEIDVCLWLAECEQVIMDRYLVEQGEQGFWICYENASVSIQECLYTTGLVEASRCFNDVVSMATQ